MPRWPGPWPNANPTPPDGRSSPRSRGSARRSRSSRPRRCTRRCSPSGFCKLPSRSSRAAFALLRQARPVPGRFLRARPRRGRITEERPASCSRTSGSSRHHQQDQSGLQSRYNAGNPVYQNVTIGGQTPMARRGEPLSFLILQSVARDAPDAANLTVRYTRARRCLPQRVRGGDPLRLGMPAFNSDESSSLAARPRRAAGGRVRLQRHRLRRGRGPGQVGYRVTGMSFITSPRTARRDERRRGRDHGRAGVRGPRPLRGHDGFRAAHAGVGRRGAGVHAAVVIVDSAADSCSSRSPDILCSPSWTTASPGKH